MLRACAAISSDTRAGACEIHLATDFQNMVYEHPQFPAALKTEMYAWIRENALEEKKPKEEKKGGHVLVYGDEKKEKKDEKKGGHADTFGEKKDEKKDEQKGK